MAGSKQYDKGIDMTATVYKKDAEVAKVERDSLWGMIHALKGLIPDELYTQLQTSMSDVDRACVPIVPIWRGYTQIGVGLSKSQKAIACDQMSAIIKQIKALKAW